MRSLSIHFLLFALGAFLVVSPTSAWPSQLVQRDTPDVSAVRTDRPINLDGVLNEPSWSESEPVTTFLQRDPLEGMPASQRTEVRLLFDSLNLYIGVVCYDSNPSAIRATELRRDNVLVTDDIFEVVLDTFHDHRNAYLFRVNPHGTQYDETISDEGKTTNSNWDEKWSVRTRITEEGWFAEIAIPFKAVRFAAGNGALWGINFHRAIKHKNEDVYWTAYNHGYLFGEVSRAGHLRGLSEIHGFRMRFKPYAITGASRSLQETPPRTRHLTDAGIEDAKFLITPQLALDLTVNPDFAQADVDQAQVNLTRFSLFFPEKREFFQEGAGIFRVGKREAAKLPELLLFHPRRIGLSANREEIPMLGGIKLTGKDGPLEVGILNAQTRRQGDLAGQNFSVARLKRNLLGRSYIGGIYTRNTGSPLGGSNQAVGLDASFNLFQHLNMEGFSARTFTAALHHQEWGHMGRIAWMSDRYRLAMERAALEENFRPEMGFVARSEPGWKGFQGTYLNAGYYPRPGFWGIRQTGFDAKLHYFANQEGLLESRNANFEWNMEFQNGDVTEVQYSWIFERVLQPFTIPRGGTIPPGDYSFGELKLDFRGYNGRAFSGRVELRKGGFYNGDITKLTLLPKFKPTKNLSIEPAYVANFVSLPDVSFTTHELNAVMNYSFTQKWLTRTTLVLNSQDRQMALNLRLNYIFRPGDDVFIVYNEARNYGAQGGLLNRALMVKATFSFDY